MSSNPSCSPMGNACDTMRFLVVTVDPVSRSAIVLIKSRPYGCGPADLPGTDLGGTVAEVCDPLGCFFNEPTEQLMGREGWARYMVPSTPTHCQPDPYDLQPEWEVFSLCCSVIDCKL